MTPLTDELRAAGLDAVVPAWPAPANVQAFVTTRRLGEGELDLAGQPGDPRHAPAPMPQAAIGAVLPAAPRWLRQVHGTTVVTWNAPLPDLAPEADAAFTVEPGVVCAVRMADCLPVLFSDDAGRAVAAAHAGWRGLAAGVLEATVQTFAGHGIAPGRVMAWLGPAIGPGAFEVGDDVIEAFVADDPDARGAFVPHRAGKWLADLYTLARRRLARAQVASVHGGDAWCTVRDSKQFHSWRRDRSAARMAALIWRR